MPRIHRLLAAFPPALALALLPAVGGCVIVTSSGCYNSARFTESRQSTVPHQANTGIDVQSANGSLTIVQGGTDQVSITARLRATTEERLKATQITTDRAADGTLQVRVAWPGNQRQGSEGCDFDITIPATSAVHLKTSNGSVRLGGLAGPAVIDTSNASITVYDHDGEVRADTSNARIECRAIKGAITADTSNASITIADAPAAVSADTSNASVEITLADANTGPVHIDTSNAGVTLRVGAAFRGRLSAHTSNAGLHMNAANAKPDGSPSKHSGAWRFGAEGPDSDISTSNGSITIEPR